MTRALLTLAAAMAFAPVAIASPDTDYPHRDWGQVATLDMSLADATTCVTRGIARTYERVITVPVEGGTDIDAGPGGGFFGVAHDPWVRLMVREDAGAVTLRAFYRHPVSRKDVGKIIEKLKKRCLKVASIAPATE